MEQNAPNISGPCIIVLLEGGEAELSKVVEERVTPCGLKSGIGVDVKYRDQFWPEGGSLVVLGGNTRRREHMYRGITPEQPLPRTPGA
jgi:hypothetical protein